MKVYYNDLFWGKQTYERAGKEISIRRECNLGGVRCLIPSIYSCREGLVVDFCVEIPRTDAESFIKNRQNHCENSDSANPLGIDFELEIKINGNRLKCSLMSVIGWYTGQLDSIEYEDLSEELMQYYQCDRKRAWKFIRASYEWSTVKKPIINTLTLDYKSQRIALRGEQFITEDPFNPYEITCIHPINQQEYNVTLHSYSSADVSEHTSHFEGNVRFPMHYRILEYSVSPFLSETEFGIEDCANSDRTMSVEKEFTHNDADTIIGCANEPSFMLLRKSDTQFCKERFSSSSLHHFSFSKTKWCVVFYVKRWEDVRLEIDLRR